MRLRIGNRNGSGTVPGGHSDSSNPRSQTSAHSAACCAWVGHVGAVADDGDGAAVRDAAARHGAPRRRSPWPARTRRRRRPRRGLVRAMRPSPDPHWVALRVPTMPARRPSSRSRSPRTNSTAGGSGSWRSTAGKAWSRMLTAEVADARHRSAQSSGARRAADARHAVRSSGVSMRGHGRARARARPAATAYASLGVVVGEQGAQAGARHQVEPGQCRQRADCRAHATSPDVAARRRVRSEQGDLDVLDVDEVGRAARRGTAEIGDRAGDAADPVVPAARQAVALDLGLQDATCGRAERGVLVDQLAVRAGR